MSSDDHPGAITPDMVRDLVREVDVTDLRKWDADPWQGDVGAAHTYLAGFGQLQLPIVVDGEVLFGGEFVQAEVTGPQFDGRVAVLDLTDLGWPREKVVAAALGLHRLERLASVDEAQLAELLVDVQQADSAWLQAAGWSGEDLDELIAGLDEPPGLGGEGADDEAALDEVPDNVPAVTKPGDIWLLGPHRVMAGDCRDADQVAALLDGATVNLAFTSPPYAQQRDYDKDSGFKPIHPDEYVDWFEPVQANVAKHLAPDGSWFVNIKEHCNDGQRVLYVKDLTLAHARRWGWMFVDEFCWERAGVPGGWPNRFKNGWEPVFHFAKDQRIRFRPEAVSTPTEHAFDYSPANGRSPSGSGLLGKEHGEAFHEGMARPSNVVVVASGGGQVSGEHSAEFPVALPLWFCRAYTDTGDVVYDPFMGSGSTLIAAHQEGRVGFGMELSPKYVDVICARWQRLTGEKPVLLATGVAHDFTGG